jgi:lysine biosynthesis protein LysW
MPKGHCPECDADIPFNGAVKTGLEVTCRNCGAFLKVISVSPIEMDWADTDWDDDWDDDDDDDF